MNPIHISMHYPRWFILLTAFATGAVVMALEILGSRLLAPVFGNSLFVWGALIMSATGFMMWNPISTV